MFKVEQFLALKVPPLTLTYITSFIASLYILDFNSLRIALITSVIIYAI
jgi:hypothetical protein